MKSSKIAFWSIISLLTAVYIVLQFTMNYASRLEKAYRDHPTVSVISYVANPEWESWRAKDESHANWLRKKSDWRASPEFRRLELVQWQRDIMAGRPLFDVCSLDTKQIEELHQAGDLRINKCSLQRYLTELRQMWLAQSGPSLQRTADVLDSLLMKQLALHDEALRHWYASYPHLAKCHDGKCVYVGDYAFLNDRALIAKILEGNPEVSSVIPADVSRIGDAPANPGVEPPKFNRVVTQVPSSPPPSWTNQRNVSRLNAIAWTCVWSALILSCARFAFHAWERFRPRRKPSDSVLPNGSAYRNAPSKCTCRCGHIHLRSES
ncbi:MAG: hypothetical protein WC551_00195 [Patescibacteria group bacterium]